MPQRSYRLEELARLVSADVRGDPACVVDGIMTLKNAGPSQLSFFDNKRYLKYLLQTQAAAVILRPEYLDCISGNALVTPDPYLAFAKLAKLFEQPKKIVPGIHPTVIVGEGCTIHPSASIAAFCVIEAGTSIQEGVVIGASCNLGEHVTIGVNSCLAARVTLYARTVIGQRVLIHSGSVIGSDGFGLARDREGWLKIPQLGRVCVGNDVEIGANVTIDRGALEDTVIEEGVKLDNQIQVGHNVHIGRNTAIAGCTGIAGSTRIGQNCMIGGGVCINGHIEITDHVAITGMSSVVHSIRTPGIYSSTLSVQAREEWAKNSARFRQIDKFIRRLKGMERLFMRRKKDESTQRHSSAA